MKKTKKNKNETKNKKTKMKNKKMEKQKLKETKKEKKCKKKRAYCDSNTDRWMSPQYFMLRSPSGYPLPYRPAKQSL